MNKLNIELPKLETLVESLNHILTKANSKYIVQFEIASVKLPEGYSDLWYRLRYRIYIKAHIIIGKLDDILQYNYKELQNYEFIFEIPSIEWDKNEGRICNEIDNKWFTEFLTNLLLIKDSEWESSSCAMTIKSISLNTLLNTKKDDYYNTNR